MSVKDLSAYELVKEEDLKGIKSHGMLLKHKKSGARILLIENDDDNKVFNIGFRTPPSDSTGVPHIMEHSVLCGSKNFPAKDPFVELVKGSLNTFLNAMTYPDKTVYPVASCNRQGNVQGLNRARSGSYYDEALMPTMRNRRDVWLINTVPYKGGHFAAFPPKLAETCIKAGCPKGGVVLDPFFGSGTTGAAARQLDSII